MFAIRAGFALGMLAVLLAGCNRAAPQNAAAFGSDLGDLPHLRASHDVELQNELARIEAEHGSPAQLTALGRKKGLPDAENVAAVLDRLGSTDTLERLDRQLTSLFSYGRFMVRPESLANSQMLVATHQAALGVFRDAIGRRACDFHFDYGKGLLAETKFITAARVGYRLEILAADVALESGKISDVAASLRRVFRMAELLGEVKHLSARREATNGRAAAWSIAERLVRHPEADQALLLQLQELLGGQLARWPDDDAVWVGDRALGLHTFEIVRAGELASLLNWPELKEMRESGDIQTATSHVDSDELFYLNAMRLLIDACREPYYKRRDAFAKIRRQMREKRTEGDRPIVSERILLSMEEIEKAQAQYAQDRALQEAWALALAAALKTPPPHYQTNPLTGATYVVETRSGEVVVRGIAPRVRLPMFGNQDQQQPKKE